VIREVFKDHRFKVIDEEPDPESNENKDWDIMWFDFQVQPKFLKHMKYYQRTNHFPGTYYMARKNYLGRNLMRLRK
jgi:tubulin polyglutamylase TTLL6/13